MNFKEARAIRGLLLLVGLTTSNCVHLYGSVRSVVANVFEAIRATALAARLAIVSRMQANLGFVFQTKRVAAASQGVTLIVEVIFLAIGLYVVAFILPGALTAIATTALTSVNAGVITMFQVLIPIIAIVVLILLLISIVRRTMGR